MIEIRVHGLEEQESVLQHLDAVAHLLHGLPFVVRQQVSKRVPNSFVTIAGGGTSLPSHSCRTDVWLTQPVQNRRTTDATEAEGQDDAEQDHSQHGKRQGARGKDAHARRGQGDDEASA